MTMWPVFLCNVVSDYLENIEYTIFICNVVVAWWTHRFIGYFTQKSCLLTTSQHCTDKNLVQCFPRGSRQHCIGKNPVQCCQNTLGTTSQRKYPRQCFPWGSRQHCSRKNPAQCCLNSLGTTFHRQKPCAMLPKRLHTILHRKKPEGVHLTLPPHIFLPK